MFTHRSVASLVLAACLHVPAAGWGKDTASGIAEVNGTKLYYEVKGEGRPLVLIHGGGFDRRMWDDQFDLFSKRFTVIRYDVRGYGRSAAPTKPYSDVDDLYSLLAILNVKKAHLAGLCMGSRIAIEFTLAHPEMVERLIVISPSLIGFPYSAEVVQGLMTVTFSIQNDDGAPAGEVWLKTPFLGPAMENPEVARKLRPIAVENSRAWLIHPFFPKPLLPLAIQRLPEIHAPTLLIAGERDLPDFHAIAGMIETGVPGVRKVSIPGAGHMVNVEKPKEFNKAMLDFLVGNGRHDVIAR